MLHSFVTDMAARVTPNTQIPIKVYGLETISCLASTISWICRNQVGVGKRVWSFGTNQLILIMWWLIVLRCGSRISARGGPQGIDDLKWNGDEWFLTRKHRFATFQDVCCHLVLEWCWTTIQETPVSLLSALETKEPQGTHPWSLRPRGGRLTQRPPPPPESVPVHS